MKIDSIRVGFISTNCYLLCDEETGVCALIDLVRSRGLGDVYKRQGRHGQPLRLPSGVHPADPRSL